MGTYGGLRVIDDTLYAVGSFSLVDSVPCGGVAKRVGGTWLPVGTFPDPIHSVMDIVKYRDTLVVIGNADFDAGRGIAYLDGGEWKLLGPGILGGMSGAHSLAVYQNDLYVGGQISLAAGNPGQEIMRWTGSAFEGLGEGLQFTENNYTSFCDVRSMVEKDGLLFVGGGCNFIGGMESRGVAVWDGSRWCSVPGDPITGGGVFGMDFYRDTLFIATGNYADDNWVNLAAKFVGASYIDSCAAPVGVEEFPVVSDPGALSWIDRQDGSAMVQGLPRGSTPYAILNMQGAMIARGRLQSDGVSPTYVELPSMSPGVYLFRAAGRTIRFMVI